MSESAEQKYVDPASEVNVWVNSVNQARYEGAGAAFQAAILEQYKIYVEMADRVSARRQLTNTYFLSLNTAVMTVFGVFWQHKPVANTAWILLPLIALLLQCAAWYYLLRSYRQLNSAKYGVVALLEERLPAHPYSHAEWQLLGEGKDYTRYWPLTHLEQWIPLAFSAVYIVGAVAAFAA